MDEATELEWLRWFYSYADFGPGDYDVRWMLKSRFMKDTGKKLPEGYDDSEVEE